MVEKNPKAFVSHPMGNEADPQEAFNFFRERGSKDTLGINAAMRLAVEVANGREGHRITAEELVVSTQIFAARDRNR